MLQATRLEVSEDLRDVFIRDLASGLEFDNQPAIKHEVCIVFSNWRAILVVDIDGVLLLNTEPELAEAMHQCILIHFLQMTMAMVEVDSISCLTDDIT